MFWIVFFLFDFSISKTIFGFERSEKEWECFNTPILKSVLSSNKAEKLKCNQKKKREDLNSTQQSNQSGIVERESGQCEYDV